MARQAYLIFPNTLYKDFQTKIKGFKGDVLIIEDIYDFKVHELKIAYTRACVMAFCDFLNSTKVQIIADLTYLNKYDKVSFYDPLDVSLMTKIGILSKENGFELEVWNDLPNFIADQHDLDYYGKRSSFSHKTFYDAMKRKLKVLTDWKNMDIENRESIPQETDIPQTPIYTSKYYKGNKKLQQYPITFEDAKKHLQTFIRTKLFNFGRFQDAISTDPFLFHSNLSCVLNNGLLLPKEVIDEVLKYAKKNRIPDNSVEGFIRQVLGWREYMRFVYTKVNGSNHWQAKRKINWDVWYGRVSSGIIPLDIEIKKCLDNAYAHHIVRLMVFLSILVMCKADPMDIVKWFMVSCSIDAYPWVMYSNIYAMGWYDPRFMKKPYISTSRYILKMSNYKKGDWCKLWDSLFYGFISENENLFIGTSRVYMMNLKTFQKKKKQEQDDILKTYHEIVNKLTLQVS